MTINDVLLKLWTNNKGSDLEKYDEKRLWMALQAFVERNGGVHANATVYDVRGGTKRIEKIQPQETLRRKIKRLVNPPLMG